jgi:hypothetical protein
MSTPSLTAEGREKKKQDRNMCKTNNESEKKSNKTVEQKEKGGDERV